jgi:hypothetical protein
MFRWLLILALLVGGCMGRADNMLDEYKAWWGSMSDSQREEILRMDVGATSDAYRIDLTDKDRETPLFVEFAEWRNGLTPGQIEAFEMYRFRKRANARDPKSSAAMASLANAVPQRIPVCRGGAWVRSKDCQPGMPMVGEGTCLRCVPGLKENP